MVNVKGFLVPYVLNKEADTTLSQSPLNKLVFV